MRLQKKEINRIIILGLIATVVVGCGIYFIRGPYNPFTKSVFSANNTYPKLVYQINKGDHWGQLKGPLQVLAYKGRLIISDTGNSRVLVFNLKGKFLFELEQKSTKENRKLRFPYGLAADGKGNIYVADPEVGKILIFNYMGKFIYEFQQDKNYVEKPAGIYIKSNRVYVTDIGLHKVFVFNEKGKLLFTLGSGKAGNSNDDFYYPNGVTVNADGKIYVSDSMNNRVQIFNKEGKYLETIGGDDSKLLNPRGVALDSQGNLYVACPLNSSIKVFDKDNLFLYEMSKDKKYFFKLPTGVYIDSNDNIYISDKEKYQVQVFKR